MALLLTEAGETLLTEDDMALVTEDHVEDPEPEPGASKYQVWHRVRRLSVRSGSIHS